MQTMWNRPLLLGHGYGVYLLFLLVMIAPTTGWSEGSFAGEIKGVKGGYANFVLIRDGIRQQLKSTIFLRVGDKIYPSNKCSGNASLSLSFSSGKNKKILKCTSGSFLVKKPKSGDIFSNFWNWIFSPEADSKVNAVALMSGNEGSLSFPMLKLSKGQTATLLDGKSQLHLAWQGGKGKYEVEVKKNNTSICKTTTRNRFYTCKPKKPLTKGNYSILIEDNVDELSWSFVVKNVKRQGQWEEKWMFEFYQGVIEKLAKQGDSKSKQIKRLKNAKLLLEQGEIPSQL